MNKKINKKQLTDEEIDNIFLKKYYKKLPHTKEYIRKRLKEDPNYFCTFSMVKEDFIEEARKIHTEGDYNYDYLPEFIQTKTEKVKIICNEIDPKTGKIFGEFYTDYLHFVERKQAPLRFSIELSLKNVREQAKDKLIKLSIEKFGNKFDFSESIYLDRGTKIKIFCKECNKYFWQTPESHLLTKFGCPYCSMKYRDYNKCGCSGKSTGEKFVENSLNKLNIKFIPQYYISGFDLGLINQRFALVDYYIEYNNLKYIIEINGRQHYIDLDFFYKSSTDFYDKIKRDQAVRMYAGINNIIFIEIPYTSLTSEDRVYDILRRILIDKEPVYKVIEQLPNYKFREEGQDEWNEF